MNPQRHELLTEWLLLWEDAFRGGQELTAATLARDHPELIELLDRRIRALKATYWIDGHEDDPTEPEYEPSPVGGRVLAGRYRLDERIAVGGFAEVWRAFDTELQRTVAVKLPKARDVQGGVALLAEARRVAQLRHPAIAPVYDVGTDQEGVFIVSEFMESGSLTNRLRKGPIPPSDGIRWVLQIAYALAYAHQRDLVHRDVKPANILISHHHDAMLTDFGISQSATRVGEFATNVGTLRYMAPELLAGGQVTPAADIYSLGMVLHEVLTGAPPDSVGGPKAGGAAAGGDRQPSPRCGLPPGIAAICRRAIRRSPAERYGSATAFAADLLRARNELDDRAKRRRLTFALAAAAVLVAIVIPFTGHRWALPSTSRHESSVIPVIASRRLAATLVPQPGSAIVSIMHHRISDALPHVVAADGVEIYTEPLSPPVTYMGPVRDGVVCTVTFRFDFADAVESATLLAATRCWDFTELGGGAGRGAAAIDVARDGIEWISLLDMIERSAWGGNWIIEDPLPAQVLGGTSLWIRVRLLTEGSPNDSYSVAQFGRNRDHHAQPCFGIVATLRSRTHSRQPDL